MLVIRVQMHRSRTGVNDGKCIPRKFIRRAGRCRMLPVTVECCLYPDHAATHFLTVSRVRVVILFPNVFSKSVMKTGPRGFGW